MSCCTPSMPLSVGKFSSHPLIDESVETPGLVTVSVKRPSLRYLDEFIGLNCAGDLLRLGLFPNAKEITESLACFRAAVKCFGGMTSCGRDDITAVVVGDGVGPRTAILFSLRTRWNAISIDPVLRGEWAGLEPKGIRRLEGIPKAIGNTDKRHFRGDMVVVFPHSHAPTEQALDRFTCSGTRHVVWLPCCVTPNVPGRPAPDALYDDYGIWSPQRTVMVWRVA